MVQLHGAGLVKAQDHVSPVDNSTEGRTRWHDAGAQLVVLL
jgi:hypothetical protein